VPDNLNVDPFDADYDAAKSDVPGAHWLAAHCSGQYPTDARSGLSLRATTFALGEPQANCRRCDQAGRVSK
jgi:hypothetical protein